MVYDLTWVTFAIYFRRMEVLRVLWIESKTGSKAKQYASIPTFSKFSKVPKCQAELSFLPKPQDSFQRQDYQKYHIFNF